MERSPPLTYMVIVLFFPQPANRCVEPQGRGTLGGGKRGETEPRPRGSQPGDSEITGVGNPHRENHKSKLDRLPCPSQKDVPQPHGRFSRPGSIIGRSIENR